MTDATPQQAVLQDLERLMPHIRKLIMDKKEQSDAKASIEFKEVTQVLADFAALDQALSRETVKQRAARERLARVDAASIIQAIQEAMPAPIQAAPVVEVLRPVVKVAGPASNEPKTSCPQGLLQKAEFLKLSMDDTSGYAESLVFYDEQLKFLKTRGEVPPYTLDILDQLERPGAIAVTSEEWETPSDM